MIEREAGFRKRTSELEAENAREFERAKKWECIAEENVIQTGALSAEVARLRKKRNDDAFELENLQEDMDTMTQNVKFLQSQNEELEAYVVRLESIQGMGMDEKEEGEDDEDEDEIDCGEDVLMSERARQVRACVSRSDELRSRILQRRISLLFTNAFAHHRSSPRLWSCRRLPRTATTTVFTRMPTRTSSAEHC